MSIPPFLLLFLPLASGRTFYHEDLEYYFFALRGRLWHGVTGWSPWASSGLPLIGDGQLGAFNPLNSLYFLVDPALAVPGSVLLLTLLATWLMWAWLRQLGCGPWPAAVGSLIFVWSGFFWQHLHHLTFLPTGLWLPALLLAVERRHWLGFAGVGALTLLGGSPQLALYLGYVSLLWAVLASQYEGGSRGRGGRLVAALSGLSRSGGAWVLAVGLAAVALAPFAYAAACRFVDPVGPWARAAQFSVHPLMLCRLLVPDLLGNPFHPGGYLGFTAYWEEGASVGIMTLPLALVGVGLWGWRGRALAALAGVSLLAMLGPLGGVHGLFFYLLPGYRLFRAPGRWYLIFTFALASLAAFGLQRLLEQGDLPLDSSQAWARARRAARQVGVLGAELLALSGLYLWMSDAPSAVAVQGWAVAAAALLLSCVGLLLMARGALDRRYVAGAAALLLLAELTLTASHFNLSVPAQVARARGQAEIELARLSAAHGGAYRVLVDDSAPPRYLNAGLEAGYYGVRGYNPLNPRALTDLLAIADGGSPLGEAPAGIVAGVEQLDSPVLGLLAARWLLTTSDPNAAPSGHRLIWTEPVEGAGPPLRIYERAAVVPRVFLAGAARVEPDAAERAAAIGEAALQAVCGQAGDAPWTGTSPGGRGGGDGSDGDLAQPVACEGVDVSPPALVVDRMAPAEGSIPPAPGGAVLAFEDGADEVGVEVALDTAAYVVLADTFAPGWEATVDGQTVEIIKAYEGLRAVPVAAGAHRIVLRYTPPGLRAGAVCSLLALCIWLALAARRRLSL